ncbi:MAG: hypothetical protein LPK85_13510, partial [Gammaproteobacteria bacterium]|nr:hypothetical protein [Gammaproteobacteria bacterium]
DVLVSAMDTKLVPLVASQKISQQDYEASLQALRQQAAEYRESRPGTWLLLYAYRDIPIAELKKYRDALETDEGRWFMRTSRHAVIEAMRSSMERFADNLVRVL